MKIEKDEIYTFKSTAGEEIIAKVVKVDETELVLRHPVSTVVTQQGMQLMPSMFTANMDTNVLIYKTSIAMIAECREDVKSSYIKATTGIDVPAKKSIITG